MKTRSFAGILAAVLLFCTACGNNGQMQAQETQAVAVHACSNACLSCYGCTNEACTEEACAVKCSGHKEEPFAFLTGDYITEAPVSVDTGTLVFDIGANVYVPAHLEDTAETVVAAIEKVSGLDFDGLGNYARSTFPDGKVHVNVSRDALYAGNPAHADWYRGLQTSEVGNAYASSGEHAVVSPGDLFLGGSNAVVHELGHVLMYRQSEWNHCQLLNEGFAEYTTYLTLLELELNAPEAACYLDRSVTNISDMRISNYTELYKYPVEYWFDNTFDFATNNNYAVGFRFMAYLDAVYGDYSKWIPAFEEAYSYQKIKPDIEDSDTEKQVQILKRVYGEDVLDNFYPWLKENLEMFDEDTRYWEAIDRTGLEAINWYPTYNAAQSVVRLDYCGYRDLYINLETVRKYLSEYKQEDITDLTLTASEPLKLRLYQADGNYTEVLTREISLEGISYIKLVGEGKLDWLEVAGSFRVSP